jgi:predicted DNA-binding transcriptional regulator AlpA
MFDDLIRPSELARSIKMSRAWIYELMKRGTLPTVFIEGYTYTSRSAAEEWRRQRKKKSRR